MLRYDACRATLILLIIRHAIAAASFSPPLRYDYAAFRCYYARLEGYFTPMPCLLIDIFAAFHITFSFRHAVFATTSEFVNEQLYERCC